MTFGRKPFRLHDALSNTSFGQCDVCRIQHLVGLGRKLYNGDPRFKLAVFTSPGNVFTPESVVVSLALVY